MSLGEQILRLRTQRKLSQGELAEALDVSRQSVSKWETDASVPELDKLLRLSELFGVTLDELVRGDAQVSPPPDASVSVQPPTAETAAPPPAAANRNHTAGVILLCTGALAVLLPVLLAGDLLSGLIFSVPFVLCGVICLTVRRNAGLGCAWAVWLSVCGYLVFATGVTWRLTLVTLQFTAEMNYIRLAFAWGMLLGTLTLAVITALRFSRRPLSPSRLAAVLTALGWIALLLFSVVPWRRRVDPDSIRIIPRALGWCMQILPDLLRTAALTALLAFSLRLLRGRRARKSE